jgi:putative salt-induced outer membrane protein
MSSPTLLAKSRHVFRLTASLVLLCASAATVLAADPPITNWVSSAAVGFTLTSGNSDSVLATMDFLTGRKWDKNELSFGANGAYGKTTEHVGTNDVTTKSAELLRGFGQYNRLLTERLYAYGRAEGLHDGIALIRYRVTVSPGLGYYFIKTKTSDLSGEVGPGYIWENVDNTNRNYAIIRVAEKFNQKLSDRARLWQSVEWLPEVENFDNYIINFEIGVEASLTADKKLALRCYLLDTYDSEPAADRKNNDVKLVTALAYKF